MSVQEREPPGWPEFTSVVIRMMWRRMRRAVDCSSWTVAALTGGKDEPAFQGRRASNHYRNGRACHATEPPAIIPLVIIDFHTHIFPPDVREDRESYLRRDATFAEMYGSPRAKIATAEELLRSMDEAEVDVSVALGFAWRDHQDCVRQNDYLLEAAGKSGGRIVPFCTVNLSAEEAAEREVERCAGGGARGLGELRPDSQGWALDGPAAHVLAELASRHSLILLFHVTEPVGHDYPGKQGLRLESFYRFAVGHHQLKLVGAHLAGGLPLYAPMPAVRRALPGPYADTAALRYLYEPSVLLGVAQALGGEQLLFGSDFPLVTQAAALADVRGSGLEEAALGRVLGENAARLLGPPAPQ
jgi:predicted TIM-barrel fold metal-dependent hydrolase